MTSQEKAPCSPCPAAGADNNSHAQNIQPDGQDGKPETTENLLDAVKRLAALSPLEYEQARKDETKRLGVRVSVLDEAVSKTRGGEATEKPKQDMFPPVQPWPEPVDGAALIDELVATVRRYVVCSDAAARAVALWAVWTWFVDFSQVAPRLLITGPTKRCGKTILLDLLARLVLRALPVSSISAAALFRSVDAFQPTLLIDEADAHLKDKEELRGIINSGHTLQSAFVLRCSGDDHEPKRFGSFCAICLAGIGKPASTIVDRSVIVELRRKSKDEPVERLRHATAHIWDELKSKLSRFAADNEETMQLARPDLPFELNDRQQDNWEPLLAIADIAGGDWPDKAREAAIILSGGGDEKPEPSTELLADIRNIFMQTGGERVFSAKLIQRLCSDETKPWATWNRGQAISPHQVARMLKGYGIVPVSIREGRKTGKGYKLAAFADAFERYLPPLPPAETVTTSQCPMVGASSVTDNKNTICEKNQNDTRKRPMAGTCNVVTDKMRVNGREYEQASEPVSYGELDREQFKI